MNQNTDTTDKKTINLPFIMDNIKTGDIEQLLESKRKNNEKNFRLTLNFLTESPRDYDSYQEHEYSLKVFFRRMVDRSFKIGTIVASGSPHEYISNNHSYKWENFMDDPIIFRGGDFQGWNVKIGESIKYDREKIDEAPANLSILKYVVLVVSEEKFVYHNDQILYAQYGYKERYLKAGSKKEKLKVFDLNIPTGSIIQITFAP